MVKSVADAFVISGGGTPSRKEDSFWQGGSIQWYSPTDLTKAGSMFIDDSSDHITAIGLAQSSARLFPARSVMLTSRATIGAIAINTHEACTNQGFITCLPNDRVPLYFLFQWLTENVPTFQRMRVLQHDDVAAVDVLRRGGLAETTALLERVCEMAASAARLLLARRSKKLVAAYSRPSSFFNHRRHLPTSLKPSPRRWPNRF